MLGKRFGCDLCKYSGTVGNGAHRPYFLPVMTTIATAPQPETPQKPKWLRTDNSACKQRGRQLGPGVFEFKEKRFSGTPAKRKVRAVITLADYSEEQRNHYAEAYYGSLAGLMKENLEDWEFILAECIFEQLSL